MKAPFAYYGGKSGMASLIVSMLPAHRVYVEPFFGSGAVLFSKQPSTHEIVNDVDHNVVTFFRVLRERPEDLERACRLTPYARAEYQSADLTEQLDDLERARRFWVRVNQSFGKALGRTGFSVTCARTQSTAASVMSRIGRFRAVAERLQRVTIECCDAASLIERMATSDTAVYLDPPYLGDTRRGTTNGGARATDYLCDMGATADHERLAAAACASPAAVVLSGYPSALYDRLYADWWRVDVPVRVHSSNAVSTSMAERTEVLWSNRPLGEGRLDLSP